MAEIKMRSRSERDSGNVALVLMACDEKAILELVGKR
jgi:hypothetical protein